MPEADLDYRAYSSVAPGVSVRTAKAAIEREIGHDFPNLEVQTRIISGARAFVGTYGGFSYLAPFHGTSTAAYFSHPTAFRFDHLEIAKRVFASLNTASFVPLAVKDLDVVRLSVGAFGFKGSFVRLPMP